MVNPIDFPVEQAPQHVQDAVVELRRHRWLRFAPVLGWLLVFAAMWAFPAAEELGRWVIGLPGFAMIFYGAFGGGRRKAEEAEATVGAYRVERQVVALPEGEAQGPSIHRRKLADRILDRSQNPDVRASVVEVLQQCETLEQDLTVVNTAAAESVIAAGRLSDTRARLVEALHRRDLLLADLLATQIDAEAGDRDAQLQDTIHRLDAERELLNLARAKEHASG